MKYCHAGDANLKTVIRSVHLVTSVPKTNIYQCLINNILAVIEIYNMQLTAYV